MPDMKKLYFVEVPKDGVEDKWVYVHETDDAEDAVKVAKTYPRARVRQLPVQYQPVQRDRKADEPPLVEVPLVEFTCLDHPDESIRLMATGHSTCRNCGKVMVTREVQRAYVAGPVVDWSGEVK